MSLKWRLAWALIALLVGLGIAVAWTGRYASQLYFHEVNQTLNASLSMYVVERLALIEDATVNDQAFKALADQAMTVNPSVEVYLLDPDGYIVAHAMPEETVLAHHVALAPIESFLTAAPGQLVLGDDPRSDQRKAFSASPIQHAGQLQGYLYVVLGGHLFDAVQASYFGSFIGRMAASVLLVVLLFGAFAGIYAIRRTTVPLDALQGALREYTESGFVDDQAIHAVPENTKEIRQLKQQAMQLTSRLALQFEQVQTNDRLRRELLANVSHDLRTPLASMQGYLETLLIKNSQLADPERRRYLEIAFTHANRLNQMVGQLFELAKLDSGAIQPELEPFLIAELLHDVGLEFELTARQKQITLSFQGLEDCADVGVVADISLIQRVLENLISNAFRYTPEGGQVEIGLATRGSVVNVAVKDNGCGIPAKLLPTIFDRHASEADVTENAGLGLAIVKRILELHDSRIEVVTGVDEGSCFSFGLSRAAA
ncbi:MAG: sensor histidine kinase [bacterium]